MFSIALFLIVYIICLILFAKYFKRTEHCSYSLHGDLHMFVQDSLIFNKNLRKLSKPLKTNLEKCEWSLEKMKDMFQMFTLADVTIWPYQTFVSLLASIIILTHLNLPLEIPKILTTSFILFVLMDLPRRFLSFHRNALIANKGLNIYSYYFRELKNNDNNTVHLDF